MDTSLLEHATDSSMSSRGTFTCQTCAIAFSIPDQQRTHYQSDWHRYNLKRRVANLTSITAAVFAEKISAQKSLAATTTERANFVERCEPCGKIYYSENAYRNHMGSNKHKEAAKAAFKKMAIEKANKLDGDTKDDDAQSIGSDSTLEGDEMEPSQQSIYESLTSASNGQKADEEMTEEEEAQIKQKLKSAVKLPLGACLFCRDVQTEGDEVEALSANINHMVKSHSLFLPEQDYLVDLRGLVEYLQTKVSVGNFCLACNKGFRNLEACRAHMASISHRRIAYSTDDEQMELSDFYDFSSTWAGIPDGDEEWEETTSDVGSDAEEVLDKDASVTQPTAEADDFELRLPSGGVAGHRSLARYYRQNLHGRDPHAPHSGSAVHKAIMDRTQAARQELVTASVAGVDQGRRKWSKKHVETFTDMRRREDFKTRVGYRANNQKHFRDPLLQ